MRTAWRAAYIQLALVAGIILRLNITLDVYEYYFL